MQYRILTMTVVLCTLANIARADVLNGDSTTLEYLAQEFLRLEGDVLQSMKGIEHKGSVEFICMENAYHDAEHMNEMFTHYRLSAAIAASIEHRTNRDDANRILKQQTVQALSGV